MSTLFLRTYKKGELHNFFRKIQIKYFLFGSTPYCSLKPLFRVLFMEMEIRLQMQICLQMQGLFSSSSLSYLFFAYFFSPPLLVCPSKDTRGPLWCHASWPTSSLKCSSLNGCKRLIHMLCGSWFFTPRLCLPFSLHGDPAAHIQLMSHCEYVSLSCPHAMNMRNQRRSESAKHAAS